MGPLVGFLLVAITVCLVWSLFIGENPPEPRRQHKQRRPADQVRLGRREDKHAPARQRAQRPPRRFLDGQADVNQVNQLNPRYTGLRERARQEGDAMARAFEASQGAFKSGNRARAKELSNEGNAHKTEMDRLNREAGAWVFRENNKNNQPGEVDLHGLFVKEAVEFTDKAVVEARRRGHSEIQLIVGKGVHSLGGQAKIKPAIEELMRKYKLVAAVDPDNAGVLIVQLKRGGAVDRARQRGASVLGAGDLSRKLDSRDDGCIIM